MYRYYSNRCTDIKKNFYLQRIKFGILGWNFSSEDLYRNWDESFLERNRLLGGIISYLLYTMGGNRNIDIGMNISSPSIAVLPSKHSIIEIGRKYFLQRWKLFTSGGISSFKVYYHDYWKKLYPVNFRYPVHNWDLFL